jgi:PleD family two-component response regulator
LLFLNGVDSVTACAFLDKLREKIGASSIVFEGHAVSRTVTIGVNEVDITDIMDSINRCDQKLYLGKNSGKNKVVF